MVRKIVKWLYVAVICGLLSVPVLTISGCWEEAAAGFASGAITTQSLLRQAEEDLAENIQAVNEANARLKILREETGDIEEKARITKMIAENENLKDSLTKGKEGTQLGQQAAKTDWSDPAQVSTFGALAISVLMNWFQNKKNGSQGKELLGLNNGIQRFEGTHTPEIAGELHNVVKNESRKAISGIT